LTGISLHLYSDAMISDFELLVEKVEKLAELAHALRRENAELRRDAAAVAAENKMMQQRMQEAHERLAKLLAQLPPEEVADTDKEAA
jgi:cell division protein ZapB